MTGTSNLVAGGAAAGLALLLLAAAVAPARHLPPGPEGMAAPDGARWGGVDPLDPATTLVVHAPTRAYSADEVAAVRAFLDAGGRLLVSSVSPAAAGLVRGLDVGVEPTTGLVYDPDVDPSGRWTATATGALGATGTVRLAAATIVSGGEAIVTTSSFAWHDRDADGSAEVGEPRGSWSIAAHQAVGQGSLVVLGAPELLADAVTGPAVAAWAQGPRVRDAAHEIEPDALGMTGVLAGHADAAAWTGAAVLAVLGSGIAANVAVTRLARRRRTRVRARDVETLETLAELEA